MREKYDHFEIRIANESYFVNKINFGWYIFVLWVIMSSIQCFPFWKYEISIIHKTEISKFHQKIHYFYKKKIYFFNTLYINFFNKISNRIFILKMEISIFPNRFFVFKLEIFYFKNRIFKFKMEISSSQIWMMKFPKWNFQKNFHFPFFHFFKHSYMLLII